MKMVFYNFQTADESWSQDSSHFYSKKIAYFFPFEISTLKVKRADRDQADYKKQKEAETFIPVLKSDDFFLLFDEKGKTVNSIQFSNELQRIFNSGKKRLVYLIGGAYGVSEEVKQKAHLKINLSSLTMNHALAQTVALEQIYRALTIINHLPYHNL